jgi:hypothetical protein
MMIVRDGSHQWPVVLLIEDEIALSPRAVDGIALSPRAVDEIALSPHAGARHPPLAAH